MVASQNVFTKQNIGIVAAVLVLVAAFFVPGTEVLPREGVLMLGVFGMAAALWICESLPVGITGLLALTLVVVLGIAPLGEAFSGFATPTMFYLMAAFSLSAVLKQTSYGMRLVVFLMKRTKGDSRLIVLAFMAAAALLSSVMSDTAAVLMFIGFGKGILDALGCKPLKSNFGRCLFIGLLYASIVGGFATLAGGPNNMTVLQISGVEVGFLDWMKVGVPVSVVMLPVCWFFVVRAFPPERFPHEVVEGIIEQTESAGAATRRERKALAFVIMMPVLWIAGNWIPALNVTVVALFGLAATFLPGVRLLTWKEYQESVPWVVLVMVGSIFSMSGLMVKTRASPPTSSARWSRRRACSSWRFPWRCCCTCCLPTASSRSARWEAYGRPCSCPCWPAFASHRAFPPPSPRSLSSSPPAATSFCPSIR